MRTIDRYILRQLAWPFSLGLAVFTFLLIVPELMKYAEEYNRTLELLERKLGR